MAAVSNEPTLGTWALVVQSGFTTAHRQENHEGVVSEVEVTKHEKDQNSTQVTKSCLCEEGPC